MNLLKFLAIAATMIALAVPAGAADEIRTVTLPLLETSCDVKTMDEARLIVATEWHQRLIGGFRPTVCYRLGRPTASDATLVMTGPPRDFEHVIKSDLVAWSKGDSSGDLVFIAAKCGQRGAGIAASSTAAGVPSGCMRRPTPGAVARPFMRVLLLNAGVK